MDFIYQIFNTNACRCAMCSLIVYMGMKIFFRRRAVKLAENKLTSDEHIICDITPFIFIDFLFALAYGHSMSKIFDFELGSDINIFSQPSSISFVVWRTAFAAIGILLLIMLSQPKSFVTNKRILSEFGNLPLTKTAYNHANEYRYENIENLCQKRSIMGSKFVIKFKNLEHPFVIFSLFTYHYKPAVILIENIFKESKEHKEKVHFILK